MLTVGVAVICTQWHVDHTDSVSNKSTKFNFTVSDVVDRRFDDLTELAVLGATATIEKVFARVRTNHVSTKIRQNQPAVSKSRLLFRYGRLETCTHNRKGTSYILRP